MPELCQHVLTANEYLKENAEEIELAEVKMQEVFAQQYEDACKAREEEGAIKLLTGGAAAIPESWQSSELEGWQLRL